MINFLQSNQDMFRIHVTNQEKQGHDDNLHYNIIDNEIWEKLTFKFTNNEKIDDICAYIYEISIQYNIDKKNIIKDYLNYIIRNKNVSSTFLNFVENVIHSQDCNNKTCLYYLISKLLSFFNNPNENKPA
jgi:hypothetical protein